jgi:membrane-bound lytic murein transglycosylase MltF
MKAKRENAAAIVLFLALSVAVPMVTASASAQLPDPAPSLILAQSASHPQTQPSPSKPETPPATGPEQLRGLNISVKERTGDLDMMIENRVIRVLVPYSRTLYFNDKGHERGLTAENMRDFERYLNKKNAKQLAKRPITVVILPTTRDLLLPNVAKGLGDIAAGNLTVTAERLKLVDFVAPSDQRPVSELLVTGPKSPAIGGLDDLAGKTVDVRKASSYYESLAALSERFKKEGKPPVNIVLVSDALEDEDMMEMLNAGLFEAIVVDDWKAKMWAQILPKIKVREDIALRTGGQIGWAIRKESSKLADEILAFYQNILKKQGLVAVRLAKYYKRIKQITDPSASVEWQRFEQTLTLFGKYGREYRFDPLMLAAQGFQESQLNQEAHSAVGAIGVMQIMPTTGAELKVGDIRIIEPNIHAGSKYMDQLMTRYFKDAKFDEQNRTLFAFASYNAGAGNISKMRKLAQQRGLDPNLWFNNVEVVTAEKIGMETTTYVRNILKYYVAYKLMLENQAEQRKAREQIELDKK